MIAWPAWSWRANHLALRSSGKYLKSNSNPLQHYQECDKVRSSLSFERRMDGNKQKAVSQIWRRVSTQASSASCDGITEDPMLPKRGEVQQHGVSPTFSTSKSGNSDNEAHNESKLGFSENDILNKKHSMSMEIGWSLMRFVKGKGGSTQKDIEKMTGVKIQFPSAKRADSIILEGDSAESITKASEKIQIIVDKAINSRELDYSHFVSLPLAIYPELVDKLVNFQNTILGLSASDGVKNLESNTNDDSSRVAIEVKGENSDASARVNMTSIPVVSYAPRKLKASASGETSSKLIELGIEESIFIKPRTFHLTVLMLKLWNMDRVKAAVEVLQRISPKVMDALENRPVLIRLKGLDCMKGSLSKARVLYAPVEEVGGEGRLLRACQVIIDAFTEAGLVIESDVNHQLKLHATIMNARHRKRNSQQKRKFDSFDARGIFDQFGSEEWGEYLLREAHLSQRFLFDENGYYHCCASIPFPQDMH